MLRAGTNPASPVSTHLRFPAGRRPVTTTEIVFAILALIFALPGIAGVFSLKDARRARREDRERQEAKEAEDRAARARRELGVRHEWHLKRALDLLHAIKLVACLVVTREELLTSRRMVKEHLKTHLTDLGVVSSSLPEAVRHTLCRDHTTGVAYLAERLLATPFPEDGAEAMATNSEIGLAALAQYDAATALVDAIDDAERAVGEHLPV